MINFIPIPYYCEENIWTLLHTHEFTDTNTYAVFISNLQKTVAFCNQKNSLCQEVVIWDYHVITLERCNTYWNVWDFNTDLGVPCLALEWAERTFEFRFEKTDYQPFFKLIPKRIFLETFCSDRSHMKNTDGVFIKPPPSWKCIGEGKTNLETFYDMNENKDYNIYNLEQLIHLIKS